MINSPSNPTGAAYTRNEIKALAEILADADISIVSDDIYESIIYDGFEFSNIANISEKLKKKTFVLNAVSKTYSMTGWRIGYMAGDETVIKYVESVQSQSTSNPTSISQWAALDALLGEQSFINDMVSTFDRRRKIMVKGLNEIRGITCLNPNGAFYAFPSIKGIYGMKGWNEIEKKYEGEYKSSKLSSFLLEEAKVAVVPGIGFGNDDYIRLSFATYDENIIEGLKRIKEAIGKLD